MRNTGWSQEGGKWYYYANGSKKTGWLYDKDKWYYMDPAKGSAVTGWCEIGGLVYDPEWTRHHEGNFFGRPLKPGESQNYLIAIQRYEGFPGYVRI